MRTPLARWLVFACCLGPAPTLARAQTLADYDYENLQFRGLGLELGWVLPTKIEPVPSFGIRGDMGFVGPHVRITPGIRYWASTLRNRELQRLADQIVLLCERQAATECPALLDLGEVRRSDLELSADAHYVLDPAGSVVFHAGGGLSLHLLNGRGEFIDGTFVEDLLDTVAPGVNLVIGAGVPLGKIEIFAEGRAVLTSDIQYGNVLLGANWTLPSPPGPGPPAPPAPLRALPGRGMDDQRGGRYISGS